MGGWKEERKNARLARCCVTQEYPQAAFCFWLTLEPLNVTPWFEIWPHVEDNERPKKEAGHPRLIGGSWINRGTYPRGLSWEGEYVSSPNRIIKVYTEALTRVSHIHYPVSMPPYSLKATSLKTAPTVGTAGRAYIHRRESGWGAQIAQVQLEGHPEVTSSWWPSPRLPYRPQVLSNDL